MHNNAVGENGVSVSAVGAKDAGAELWRSFLEISAHQVRIANFFITLTLSLTLPYMPASCLLRFLIEATR